VNLDAWVSPVSQVTAVSPETLERREAQEMPAGLVNAVLLDSPAFLVVPDSLVGLVLGASREMPALLASLESLDFLVPRELLAV